MFDDQCVSILVSGKIRGWVPAYSEETHCQDDTNEPRQAKSLQGCKSEPGYWGTWKKTRKSLHGCNENLSLDTGEHERKQDNIELILTGKRVCNIHTFVHILFIIKMLNCKTIRVC